MTQQAVKERLQPVRTEQGCCFSVAWFWSEDEANAWLADVPKRTFHGGKTAGRSPAHDMTASQSGKRLYAAIY